MADQVRVSITADEIAKELGIRRSEVYALLERGEIPGIRLKKKWLVTRYAYTEWLQRCGTTAKPSAQYAPTRELTCQ